MGGAGLADAGDGLQQVAPPAQVRVAVDVAADALPHGLQLALQRLGHRPDGRGRVGVGGVQPVALHLDHFQQILDPAQQGLQGAQIGRQGPPQRGLLLAGEAGDEFRVGLVGLGPAQFGFGEGGGAGRVDHADRPAAGVQALGQGQAAGPGGLHANQGAFAAELVQPDEERREACGVVAEALAFVAAPRAKAGGVEGGFVDVCANVGRVHKRMIPWGVEVERQPCAGLALSIQAHPARRGLTNTVQTVGGGRAGGGIYGTGSRPQDGRGLPTLPAINRGF